MATFIVEVTETAVYQITVEAFDAEAAEVCVAKTIYESGTASLDFLSVLERNYEVIEQ